MEGSKSKCCFAARVSFPIHIFFNLGNIIGGEECVGKNSCFLLLYFSSSCSRFYFICLFYLVCGAVKLKSSVKKVSLQPTVVLRLLWIFFPVCVFGWDDVHLLRNIKKISSNTHSSSPYIPNIQNICGLFLEIFN